MIKGAVPGNSPQADYQIDGLSGSHDNRRGVSNLVRYWLGPDGFGPYLEKLRGEHSNQTETSDLTLGNCRRGGDHG